MRVRASEGTAPHTLVGSPHLQRAPHVLPSPCQAPFLTLKPAAPGYTHTSPLISEHCAVCGCGRTDVGSREKRRWPRVHLCSVVSSSLQPRGLQPARLLCPWDFPGKNTGLGAISCSRGPSRPGDGTASLVPPALAGGLLTTAPRGKPPPLDGPESP